MSSTNTTTEYCVANGNAIVGSVTFSNPDDASAYLNQVNQQLQSLGVKADVYVASVDTTTTTTDPVAYTAPQPTPVDDTVPETDVATDTTLTVQTSDDTTPTTDTTTDVAPTA